MTISSVVPEFDLGDRLGKALRVAHISNQDMADYLGVSRNTVSNYINGRGEPKRATLLLWALRTGVSLTWLQTGQAGGGEGEIDAFLDSERARVAELAQLRTRRDSNSQPSDLECVLTAPVVELAVWPLAA